VTSVVVKAFPKTSAVTGNIRFSTTPDRGSNTSISTETFWAGMKTYWTHATSICDAGGLGYSFIYPEGSPQGLTFTVRISLPNKTIAQYRTFIQPLLSDLTHSVSRSPISPSSAPTPTTTIPTHRTPPIRKDPSAKQQATPSSHPASSPAPPSLPPPSPKLTSQSDTSSKQETTPSTA
jgi:hypothetical protein